MLSACARTGEHDSTDIADAVVASAPVLAMSTVATANTAACAKVKAVKVAAAWRTCDWDGKGAKPVPCAKFSPPISDRCTAETSHSIVNPDFSYFGEVDCRSIDRTSDIRRIVVHNGDDAAGNNESWKCRYAGAHYTIDRNGEIYQHMGEERAAFHANTENADTIGIELAIKRKYGTTCNSMGDPAKVAADLGLTPEDIIADICGPSKAQYEALANLVADIKTRHPIADDGIFGHCEVKAATHGDPKAFDWHALGMPLRKAVNKCGWYHVAAVKTAVVTALREQDGTRIFLAAGSAANVEVGDHGYLEDDHEAIIGWFVVDKVEAKAASAWVAMKPTDVLGKGATLVATPGTTPKALAGKAAATAVAATKPALGSCETEYTYWKSGKITSWTTAPDGTIDTLTFENLGWMQRVCDDASGLIYLGDSTDRYLTDGAGTKIRFRMKTVDQRTAVATVFEGKLRPAELGTNRRVVTRAKP